MLGTAPIIADVTLASINAFDYAGATSLLGSLKFSVEEEEMLVDLKFLGVLNHSVADGVIDLTFFLDGVDQAALADGLVRKTCPSIALQGDMVNLELTLRVPKGEHQLQLHGKTVGATTAILMGATWNASLQARRHDHPATAAANANSKVQGIY